MESESMAEPDMTTYTGPIETAPTTDDPPPDEGDVGKVPE